MWKPNLFALRAIGGCRSNRSTVRRSYMFTAHSYLTKSTSAGDIRADLNVWLLTQMVYLCPCLHLYCLKQLGLNYGLRWYQYSSEQCTKVWWSCLPNPRWQMLVSHDFLLMGNSCLWGGLNCGTCRFPHPPGNLSYSAAFSTLYSIRATQRFGLSSLVWDSDGLGVIMSGR